MKRVVAAMAMCAACAPPRAERLHTPTRVAHAGGGDEAEGPVADPPGAGGPARPELAVAAPPLHVDVTLVDPDPTPELRWPLGLADHPELVPHFDVAKTLAEPGLDWTELCAMGAHKRTIPKLRDELVYLRAWCAAGVHDFTGAIEGLRKLRSTVVPGLAAAVRVDLSNILVSHDPSSARAMIQRLGLADEADVLDRLAATYVEVGRPAGAVEINELALANDSGRSPAKTCQRLARRVLLDPEPYRTSRTAFSTKAPVPGFEDDATALLFGAKLDADPRCKELDAELSCWLAKENCAAWYALRGVAQADAYLLAASAAWPTGEYRARPEAWWHVVGPAMNARPARLAYEYTLLALEAALKLTSCTNDLGMTRVRDAMVELVNDGSIPAELAERVTQLHDKRSALCWRGP